MEKVLRVSKHSSSVNGPSHNSFSTLTDLRFSLDLDTFLFL